MRLQIVRFVVEAGSEGAVAGKIQASVDIPASTLSFHLKRRTQAGLLPARSEGTFLYYTAEYTVLRELTEYLWEDCCKGGSPAKGCG